MADNVDITPGTGATVAADLIAGALHQRMKITVGADGTNDGDVCTANPMPVVQTGTPGLPTGAATAAKQLPDGHNVVVTSGAVTASQGTATNLKTQAECYMGGAAVAVGNPLEVKLPAATVTTLTPPAAITGFATAALQGGGLPAALGAGGGLKVDGSGTALPVSLASVPSHAVTNAGTFATQVDGSALTALQLIDDPVIADDAAFTPATSKVMMAGFEADETATDSVDEGDAGAARMTLDRKQIVTLQPHTSGGLSVANFNSGDTYTALTNSAQVIKASAGQLYGYYIFNPNASAAYVMIYNIAAASVTVGTSTAQMVFCIPAGAGANLALPNGVEFTNAGWSIAAATTGGGNSAPSTALEAMIFYK